MNYLKIFYIALVFASCSGITSGQGMESWYVTGSKSASYEIGQETEEYNNKQVYYIKSKENVAEGFGSIAKDIRPGDYIGKRVRLSGYIKSENVITHAGMWMRVDGNDTSRSLAFDNMNNRYIQGTTDWKKYEIVLDVSDQAQWIAYGVILNCNGQVWLSDLSFEVVGNDVPATNTPE
jgi:hypothetical protein